MNVKGALGRKLGPLPAWGWLALFAGGMLAYRRLRGQQAAVSSSSGPPPLSPPSHYDPVVLSSGESVYDPNTGKLVTPGAGDGGGGDHEPPPGEPPPKGKPPKGKPPKGKPPKGKGKGSGHKVKAIHRKIKLPKRPRLKAKHVTTHRARPAGRAVKHAQGPRVKGKHPAHRQAVAAAHVGAARTTRGTVKTHAAKPAARPPRPRPKTPVVATTAHAHPAPVAKAKPAKRAVRHR